MNIVAVNTNNHNGPTSTTIWALKNADSLPVPYVYSHTHELLHDPNATCQWLGWNGGTLTEAILYVISLQS